jgi:hypothetical protein
MQAGPAQEGLGIFARSVGGDGDESEAETMDDGEEKDDVEFHVRIPSSFLIYGG